MCTPSSVTAPRPEGLLVARFPAAHSAFFAVRMASKCPQTRRAAGLARKDVDSPTETRLRLLLVLAGPPEPTVNMILRARDGSWRRRYDLAYEEFWLIIKNDGRQHAHDNPAVADRHLPARRARSDALATGGSHCRRHLHRSAADTLQG